MKIYKKFMEMAIAEAKRSYQRGDYPIGACIARGDEIIASCGNRAKTKDDSTKHAEIELIRYAVSLQFGPYLEDCVLYSTHAPCAMCMGAVAWAKLKGVVYGASQEMIIKHNSQGYYKWRGQTGEPEDIWKYMESAHPNLEFGRCMVTECEDLFNLKRPE